MLVPYVNVSTVWTAYNVLRLRPKEINALNCGAISMTLILMNKRSRWRVDIENVYIIIAIWSQYFRPIMVIKRTSDVGSQIIITFLKSRSYYLNFKKCTISSNILKSKFSSASISYLHFFGKVHVERKALWTTFSLVICSNKVIFATYAKFIRVEWMGSYAVESYIKLIYLYSTNSKIKFVFRITSSILSSLSISVLGHTYAVGFEFRTSWFNTTPSSPALSIIWGWSGRTDNLWQAPRWHPNLRLLLRPSCFDTCAKRTFIKTWLIIAKTLKKCSGATFRGVKILCQRSYLE